MKFKKPGQFQPNLTQSILRWRGLKFDQMKDHVHFQKEIIAKKRKYIDNLKNPSSAETLGKFQPKLTHSNLSWREFKFVQIKGNINFRNIIAKCRKYLDNLWKSSFPELHVQFQPNSTQSILGEGDSSLFNGGQCTSFSKGR